MLPFKPVPLRSWVGQAPAAPAEGPMPSLPDPDMVFAGHVGIAGVVETLAVLAATAAGAWVGIRTGLRTDEKGYVRAAGWMGGVGAALIGLLYLGTKTGATEAVGLPSVRISPV